MKFYEFRIMNELEIVDISELMGISSKEYIDIENQTVVPSFLFVKRFCEHFNISSNYLYGIINNPLPILSYKYLNKDKIQ